MIEGIVTGDRDPVVHIQLSGFAGQRTDVEAVIDTGFNDALALPSDIIALLGLPFAAPVRAQMADGRFVALNYYRGRVRWNNETRELLVLEAEAGPLVGMSLMLGFELRIEVLEGGRVQITPMRSA